MDDDLKWLIGVSITVMGLFISTLIGVFRNLSAKISGLHGRVDEVKEKYVRRDDLDGHIARIDTNLRELREETRQNHREILQALASRSDK